MVILPVFIVQMGKYDSAIVYASLLPMDPPPGLYPGRAAIFGQIYLNGTKEYDKAIAAFTRVNDTVIKYIPDTIYATAGNLINIGQAYDGKKDYNTALEYAGKGIVLLEEKNNRPEMMRGYQVLSTIYHHLGNNDSAYEYLLKYTYHQRFHPKQTIFIEDLQLQKRGGR